MLRRMATALLMCWPVLLQAAPGMTAEELSEGKSQYLIVDVRTAQEYAEGHIPDAINVPHDQIVSGDTRLKDGKGRQVVVYCRSGRRSALAAEQLEKMGFNAVRTLKGDMPGWIEKGLPVERGDARVCCH